MAIRRYIANADNTITKAFKSDLETRGTGSNMGLSDVSDVFTIYGQASATSIEVTRILTQFPISSVSADRTSGAIPASGSVSFVLRMFNAKHSETLPKGFSLNVSAVKAAWEEGDGLDMEEYEDLTYDATGSNWIKSAGSTSWTTEGGDFHSDVSSSFSASFSDGAEDLEVDITPLVEQWLGGSPAFPGGLGSKTNYGVIVMFPTGSEAQTRSYYTKKFFARGTQYWFKRPVLEARWDSSKKDNAALFTLVAHWPQRQRI